MKLVKEHINEKFTQDSDPISDLNIGLAAQIDKWIKTTDEYKSGNVSKEKDYLWICSKHNQIDFVRYLLDAGADVYAKNDAALRNASYYGHEKVVKLLLDAGADVHTYNGAALRLASENGHEKVVKLLLDAGADVHANNDLALRWASNNGHVKVVKLLLDAGADVHADNDAALRWASNNGHEKVVKLLKDYIAKEKKSVKESLNEKFTQDSDPVEDLRIGVKPKIEEWLKEYKNSGRSWISEAKHRINKDLTIDVSGSVNLYKINLEKLPYYIQFNKVTGNFWINSNKLTTLKGCPRHVGKTFYCCDNKLTSLEFAPKYVGDDFFCNNNSVNFTEEDVRKVCNVKRRIRL